MREEARERIHAHFEVYAKWMRDKQNIDPELVIREGEPVAEILRQIEEDGDVGVLVLGASIENRGPGPIIAELSRSFGSLPIPVTIVPGELSKEKLEAIT
jgi:nucleotide-binding universal stress UspA family protein